MKTLDLKLTHVAGRIDLQATTEDGATIDIQAVNITFHVTGLQGVKLRLEMNIGTAEQHDAVDELLRAIRQLGRE